MSLIAAPVDGIVLEDGIACDVIDSRLDCGVNKLNDRCGIGLLGR